MIESHVMLMLQLFATFKKSKNSCLYNIHQQKIVVSNTLKTAESTNTLLASTMMPTGKCQCQATAYETRTGTEHLHTEPEHLARTKHLTLALLEAWLRCFH